MTNIIIYEDTCSTIERVWTIPASDAPTFSETLANFYEYCGGRTTTEIFEIAINNMGTYDACELFNQLVNGVKLIGVYMACMESPIYREDK